MSTSPFSRRTLLTGAIALAGSAAFNFSGLRPLAAQAAEHPLDPILKIAYGGLKNIEENIQDYTCTLVKRERIEGKLLEPEYMFTKVRHKPFSVYMYFLKPDKVAGREVIYVHGANDGHLIAHETGLKGLAGAVKLLPTSALATKDNRYPITEVGIYNLTNRLIQVAENDRNFGECSVRTVDDAQLQKRPVQMIEVTHPVPRKNFLFNVARVYIDKEMNIPVRYEAYNWPAQPGGAPELTEEYTYLNVKVNQGLQDSDFDPQNEAYNFVRKRERNSK